MATWHQEQNLAAVRALWAPEPGRYKCIDDKLNQMASCISFDNLSNAQRYCIKTGAHLILPLEKQS